LIASTWAGVEITTYPDVPASAALALFTLAMIAGVLLLLVALSSMLVEYRDGTRQRGEPDLFLVVNSARSENGLLGQTVRSPVWFSTVRRWFGAPDFVVGNRVRIRSADEVASTLDEHGCLHGLPFMPEMAKFCGTVGIVFRCVDKVYDYGGKKDLRRLKDTVLVTGLRCDGSAHDGCQAGCYLLWKTAWLAQADESDTPAVKQADRKNVVPANRSDISFERTPVDDTEVSERRYTCQFTELVNSSDIMKPWDLRQDLRPFIAGNMTTVAFGVALLTRLFNAAQRLRGGTGYPVTKTGSVSTSGASELALQPGEVVCVASPGKIFETLNSTGKNRGLWFGEDMLKHCGLQYRVLRRVDKIIDDASGRMIRMKTPCLILDGVHTSGEPLRFCAQHDYAFWREAWLERVKNFTPPVTSDSMDGVNVRMGVRSGDSMGAQD
jgi:hypothetical protein